MLSSVLNSERAVQVNIEIMRAFVRLRETVSTHKDLARKLIALESRYDRQFKVVFDAIRGLMKYPLRVELPAYLQDYRAALMRHPAMEWAADIYRLHRGDSAAVSPWPAAR
jgi:hypothetical protein